MLQPRSTIAHTVYFVMSAGRRNFVPLCYNVYNSVSCVSTYASVHVRFHV